MRNQKQLRIKEKGGSKAMCGNYIKRAVSLIFAILMIFSVMSVSVFAENEETDNRQVKKTERKYEIAVVYDNSGSMYGDASWCRAKYAMGIFASMLNYDSYDKLTVFPMWEVTLTGDKNTPPSKEEIENNEYIQISSQDEVSKISNMLTLNAGATPTTQIDKAYNYLAGITDDKVTDKWLIVLTDGEFDKTGSNVKLSATELRDHLTNKASDEIKVQYLGCGSEATELKSDEANNFYARKSSSSSELRKDLIDICNTIFKRSVLPPKYISGETLEFGVSMSKIIVFAQGEDAKIVSLTNQETNETVKIVADSGDIKYSELGAADYPKAPVDSTLHGRVVSFDGCKSGFYALKCEGTSNIQIFYEPNVDIKVRLLKGENEIDFKNETVYPGEYSVKYDIIDNETGKVVTGSDLLGGNVKLEGKAHIKNGDDQREDDIKNGGTIELKAGDEIFFDISGKYLDDYTITTRENIDENSVMISDFPDVPEFKAEVDILQEDDWYALKNRDDWKPVKVSFTVGGQPLTDEQMKRVACDFSMDPELSYDYELLPGESAIAVYIAKDENGDDIPVDIKKNEPDITGSYKFTVTAKYTDENGKVSNESHDKDSFRIEKYSPLILKLIGLALLLGLLALIYFLTHLPAFPEDMRVHQVLPSGNLYPVDGEPIIVDESFNIELNGVNILSGEARKKTPWCNRKKPEAKVEVNVTGYSGEITRLLIDGNPVNIEDAEYIELSNGTRIVADGINKTYEIKVNPEI